MGIFVEHEEQVKAISVTRCWCGLPADDEGRHVVKSGWQCDCDRYGHIWSAIVLDKIKYRWCRWCDKTELA